MKVHDPNRAPSPKQWLALDEGERIAMVVSPAVITLTRRDDMHEALGWTSHGARMVGLAVVAALAISSRASAQAANAAPNTAARDSADALVTFRENLDAIHKRDKARYLATYVHTERLVRHSPAALETGYAGWSAITDNAWPDTLIVREMRVVPIAPGVVYGYYRYIGVPTPGDTLTGVSTRVFVRTPKGMRITVTASWNDAVPAGKR